MQDLRKLKTQNIIFGSWSGHLPSRKKSYMVGDKTALKILEAIRNGKTVLVGNTPDGRGEMLAQVNSRYHGCSIRTIRAILKKKEHTMRKSN